MAADVGIDGSRGISISNTFAVMGGVRDKAIVRERIRYLQSST